MASTIISMNLDPLLKISVIIDEVEVSAARLSLSGKQFHNLKKFDTDSS
jgi:hypothetical protein